MVTLHRSLCVATCICLFIALPLYSNPLVYEPFPSAATETTGCYTEDVDFSQTHNKSVPATLGSWSGNWNHASSWEGSATGLTFTDPFFSDRSLVVTGGSADYTSDTSIRTNRFISSTARSDTTYFSFLIELDAMSGYSVTGLFGIGYTTGSGPAREQATMALNMQSGVAKARCYGTNSTESFTLETGKTYLVVGKLEFDVNANDDERVTLWINPALSDGEANAAFTKKLEVTAAPVYTGAVNTVWIQQGATTSTSMDFAVDEVRVSDAWDEVTPSVTKPTGSLFLYDPFPTASTETFRRYTQGVAFSNSHNRSVPATEGQWSGSTNHGDSHEGGATGLTYTDTSGSPDLKLVASGGSAAYNSGGTTNKTNRSVSSSALSKTTYFSFLFRADSFGTGGVGQFGLGWVDGPPHDQALVRINMNSGVVQAKCYGTTNTADTHTLSEDTTYLIVGKIEFDVNGNGDEKVTVYVNPSLGKLESDASYSAKLEVTGNTTSTPGNTCWISQAGTTDATLEYNYDELRIGKSWESVLPTEPVTDDYIDVTCTWEDYGTYEGPKVVRDSDSAVLMNSKIAVLSNVGDLDCTTEMIASGIDGGFDLKVTVTNDTDYPQQLPQVELSGFTLDGTAVSYLTPKGVGLKKENVTPPTTVQGWTYPRSKTYSPLLAYWDTDFAVGVSCNYNLLEYGNQVYIKTRKCGGLYGGTYYVQFDLAGFVNATSRIPGDMDRDGDLDSNDDTVFDDAIIDPHQWQLDYGGMSYMPADYGDFNGDGVVTSADQDGFDAQMLNSSPTAIRGVWIPPGATWTFVFPVRFAEPASHMLTLEPYRQFFKSMYGPVRYVADRRPILGRHVSGMNWYDELTNPRAFEPNHRVDQNGWETWIDMLLNTPYSYGYRRFMHWRPGGNYSPDYGQYNFAYEIMTEWTTIMNTTDDEFDRLGNNDCVYGFWWGRASQVSGGWDTDLHWIHDIFNQDDYDAGEDEMDLCETHGAYEVGLDAFTAIHNPKHRMMRLIELQTNHTSLRFIVEPAGADFLHVLAPTFVLMSDHNGPAALADWLNPGHETWVSLRGDFNTLTNLNNTRDRGMAPCSMNTALDFD